MAKKEKLSFSRIGPVSWEEVKPVKKLDGYKKLAATIITLVMVVLNTVFNKEVDIDVTIVVNALFVVIGAVYVVAQAFHDISKEKTKQGNGY